MVMVGVKLFCPTLLFFCKLRSSQHAFKKVNPLPQCNDLQLNPWNNLLSNHRLIGKLACRSLATGANPESEQTMAGDTEAASCIVVYVTVPNKDAGRNLAKSIINARLAACVNQVPGVESTYWWQGKVETDAEELLIIKTRQSLLEALTEHVKANHPYEVPEVIALPIVGGSPSYLKWLVDNTATV